MNLGRRFGLLVAVLLTPGSLSAATAAAASTARGMAHIRGSFLPIHATKTGQMSASRMSVEVVWQPANAKGLSSLRAGLYTKGSADYGHWLSAGQFDSMFAPSRATVQAMTSYLQGKGLAVQRTGTPFLLRAIGSSAQIDTAFGTTM